MAGSDDVASPQSDCKPQRVVLDLRMLNCLIEQRRRQRLRMKVIARCCGVSVSQVKKWEYGLRSPTLAQFEAWWRAVR